MIFQKMRKFSLKISFIATFLSLTLTTTLVHADDTEIFLSSGNTANVLLIFDLSGSMGSPPDGSTTESKYQILLNSLTTVLGNLKAKTNLRIGLSLYGVNGAATGIRWPIRSISEDANLTDSAITAGTYETHSIILKQLADYGTDGGTPIVDALYEAALYFKGDPVSNGIGGDEPPVWDGTTFAGGVANSAHPASYNPATAWDSGTNTFDPTATYISPIVNSCDNNYIVLLTDGQPTVNTTISDVETMIGASCADPTGSQPYEGKCGPELVSYLANTDLQSGAGITPSKVTTHTIGFAVGGDGEAYLKNLAALGGGNFFSANDATSLEQSLDTVLTKIASDNESFSGLATSIKASTLSSDNRVFINLFKPSADRSWAGNTKGYFIDPVNGLTDLNGTAAIDTSTGLFVDTAQSFWSSGADGNNVDVGGLSGKISPGTRDIYTYTGAAPVPLNSALTKITTSDASITAAMFNALDDTEKDDLINWLYNAPMGDPLHANTVVVSYDSQDVLFTMTNQGLLHAFDVTTPTTTGDLSGGSELFAYIPQSLLPNVKEHKANLIASDHIYGLDGSITYWHDDTNNDHIVNGSEKVYLYFGMRRGGNQYFALDVTNPYLPKLAWRIDGGTTGFTTLGQTWSRPVVTTINWNGGAKKVIIFGGGYNVAQDGYTVRTTDTIGNAIYIVDAANGNLLWSAGSDASHNTVESAMQYSVPSDLTVIDTDNDTYADRLYFGDMGGQIWRVDLDATFDGSTGVTVYRLAELADNKKEKSRRFYMPPSVALMKDNGNLYYAVAIGSGFRAHPLSTDVDDRFYMIKDTNLTSGGSWTMLDESDLYDTTANLVGEGTKQADEKIKLQNKSGWLLKLTNAGEKVLSPSLIFNYGLAFTTYTPASTTLTCGGASGAGRLYLVNLKDATPVKDLVSDNNLIKEDRHTVIPGIGIPTPPIPYFPPEKGYVDIYIGKQKAIQIDNPMARINWRIIE